jgi:hypothetical protein
MEGDFAEMETSEGQSAARDGLKAELARMATAWLLIPYPWVRPGAASVMIATFR